MKNETIKALGAFVATQRSSNTTTIATLIEIIKLFPAGPTREPAIERLQILVEESQRVEQVADALFEALKGEVNATRS